MRMPVMYYHYPMSILFAATALVSSAAVSMPTSVRSAEDLLPILRECDTMSVQDIRQRLMTMPIPESAGIPFQKKLYTWKGVALWMNIEAATTPEAHAAAVALMQKETPLIWVTMQWLAMAEAEKNGDAAEAEDIRQEVDAFLTTHQQELGFISHVHELKEFDKHPEEKKGEILHLMSQDTDASDGMASLAVAHVRGGYGMEQDVEKALSYALRAVSMEAMLWINSGLVRSHMGLLLARVSDMKGEAAFPLKLAALRLVLHGDGSDDGDKGVAAYLLTHAYEQSRGAIPAAEALQHSALKEGVQYAHPACLHLVAEKNKETDAELSKEFYRRAEEAGYDPETDYRTNYLKCCYSRSFNTPDVESPYAAEREAEYYLRRWMSKARYEDVLQANPTRASLVSLFTVLIAGGDEAENSSFVDSLDGSDAVQETDSMAERLGKWESMMKNSQLREATSQMRSFYKTYLSQPHDEGMPLELLRFGAQCGEPYSVFILAHKRILFDDSFTLETLQAVRYAHDAEVPAATRFLYEVMSEGKYGVEANPVLADALYAKSLALLSAESWCERLKAAETEEARLVALIHLFVGSAGADYALPLDEALTAYAEKHPELADVITPLRILCLDFHLRKESLSPEQAKTAHERLLELALTAQPAVMTNEQVDYHRALIDWTYRVETDAVRRSAARKGMKSLDSGEADVVLVRDREVCLEELGEGRAVLQALCEQRPDELKGAHLVLRTADMAIAELAVAGGVKSVSADKMDTATRDYLRKHHIAAGARTIIPIEQPQAFLP